MLHKHENVEEEPATKTEMSALFHTVKSQFWYVHPTSTPLTVLSPFLSLSLSLSLSRSIKD